MTLNLACVLVHHNNYPHVIQTMTSLLQEGIAADSLVVVDNSPDDRIILQLRAAAPAGVSICRMDNRGYAAAVNFGVAQLGDSIDSYDAILVATHEVEPTRGALAEMFGLLRSDPSIGAVGPALVAVRSEPETLWSMGGELTTLLNRPRHVLHGVSVATAMERVTGPRPCKWLDGAFVLYRARLLASFPLPEEYFLYFEEVDYHAQLRRAGYEVVCCPSASVAQDTHGVPPYYLARNMQIFQTRNGTRLQRVVTPFVAILRATLTSAIHTRSWVELPEFWRGWRDGREVSSRG